MNIKQIYFKSDFTVILASEAQWGGCPFRLSFYTASPSRAFVASFDGENYENCRLLDDGRLEIGINQKDGTVQNLMGIGTLYLAPEFYLDNDAFRDHVCNQFVKPFVPTFTDTNGTEYCVALALDGCGTLQTIGTLPAYYQAGLTKEEHEALIEATVHAEEAANEANEQAGNAETAARHANEAREQIMQTFNEKVAALDKDYADTKTRLAGDYTATKSQLDSDYTQKKQALDADYASVKQQLDSDYTATKSQLDSDYTQKKTALEQDYSTAKAGLKADYDAKTAALAKDYNDKTAALAQDYAAKKQALDTAYATAIEGINNRMKAIEDDYATNKQAWQQAVANAVNAANTAATEASRVNVTNNGTILTITGRDGQQHTVNVKGDKGDPGESFTMFPNVTIFGQPRIQESQISGFTANDYVQMPFVVDFAGRHWQIDFAFTTGANVTNQQNILDSLFGLAFAVAQGKMEIALSSNGTSWDLGAHFGTHTLSPNTTYYVRITFDGAKYVVAMSTGGIDYVTDITVTSSASLYPRQIVIGKSLDSTHIFGGSIDLMKAHLVISDKAVWDGMADAGLATRMAVDMSNIDAEGKQKVLDIVGEGTGLVVNKDGLLCMEFE